ncbi:MAG: hypothetical protein NXH84_11435 [Rhodobacteraceae bacterium]|nr:hypothetical protein [Paracoccaceae bacterium]
MFKFLALGAGLLAAGLGTAAQADLSDKLAATLHLASDRSAMPPSGHQGQWWTHPKGCEYSRAGRPGETVWYLIINTARPGCPKYIVSHSPYNDVY